METNQSLQQRWGSVAFGPAIYCLNLLHRNAQISGWQLHYSHPFQIWKSLKATILNRKNQNDEEKCLGSSEVNQTRNGQHGWNTVLKSLGSDCVGWFVGIPSRFICIMTTGSMVWWVILITLGVPWPWPACWLAPFGGGGGGAWPWSSDWLLGCEGWAWPSLVCLLFEVMVTVEPRFTWKMTCFARLAVWYEHYELVVNV